MPVVYCDRIGIYEAVDGEKLNSVTVFYRRTPGKTAAEQAATVNVSGWSNKPWIKSRYKNCNESAGTFDKD